VLSVGDVAFQRKCAERMARFREQGVTFVLVSHALPTIASLCARVVWMDGGRIVADGRAEDVIAAFTRASGEPSPPATGQRVA
jgi:ABC-type polysaccharide/polyol phosphate transport system ATPase subunit